MNLEDIILAQRKFFQDNKSTSLEFRTAQLKKLQKLIFDNELALQEAVYKDLNKSFNETYQTELSLIHSEIRFYLKHLKKFIKPQKVSSTLASFPSKNMIIRNPLGNCLIIGAWNYPIQLTLMPLIAAIAAGNTIIIKPSELSIHTANVIKNLINANFSCEYLHVITGSIEIVTKLLSYKFNHIFFTGSTKVGKIIANAASEHLSTITLELGGKSPCFVFADTNLQKAAKRIIWGKFLNAGQTCIAPDYLLIEKKIYKKFLDVLKDELIKFNKAYSNDYPKIINEEHYTRLLNLIIPNKILIGGKTNKDTLTIMPTIMQNIDLCDPIMQEEIFGPILPALEFDDLESIIKYLKNQDKPLASYIFTHNQDIQNFIINNLDFGGACINDVLLHTINHHLPFGGIGESGMGRYHGYYGFLAFTYAKSIMQRPFWGDWPLRYPKLTKFKMRLLRLLLG